LYLTLGESDLTVCLEYLTGGQPLLERQEVEHWPSDPKTANMFSQRYWTRDFCGALPKYSSFFFLVKLSVIKFCVIYFQTFTFLARPEAGLFTPAVTPRSLIPTESRTFLRPLPWWHRCSNLRCGKTFAIPCPCRSHHRPNESTFSEIKTARALGKRHWN